MNEITVASAHGYNEGDVICFSVPDNRWWKRLIHWMLFMNPPVKKSYHKISNVVNKTTITVKEFP